MPCFGLLCPVMGLANPSATGCLAIFLAKPSRLQIVVQVWAPSKQQLSIDSSSLEG